MAVSQEIMIRMGYDNSKVDRGLRSTKQKAKQTASSIGSSFKQMGTRIAAAFTFTAAIAGMKSLLKFADDIGNVSANLGVGAEWLQRFGSAAEQSGIASEKASLALEKLVQKVGLAQAGYAEYQKIFDRFGINVDGKTPEEVVNEVANALARLPDQFSRQAAAMKLMEEGGAAMSEFLAQGATGINNLMKEANALTDDQIRRLDRADKAIKRLQETLRVKAGEAITDFDRGQEAMKGSPGLQFMSGLTLGGGGLMMGAVERVKTEGLEAQGRQIDKESAQRIAAKRAALEARQGVSEYYGPYIHSGPQRVGPGSRASMDEIMADLVESGALRVKPIMAE